jgi:hypothetical protein
MSWSCLNLFVVLTFLPAAGLTVPTGSGNRDGELIHYKLRYSIFQVGVATVACRENQAGEIYHIHVEARSNGLVKLFNNMNYRLECYVDPETGLPDSTIIDLKDRKHSLYNELRFYQDARPDSARVESKLSGEHIVSRKIYEMLTGFYHFREDLITEDQYHGKEVVIQTFYPDKPWELRFIYAGEEELKTAIGELHCYTYNPGTIAGRFFEREDAMTVWFTQVKPHIPVRFRLDLKIGAIHGVIVDYSN